MEKNERQPYKILQKDMTASAEILLEDQKFKIVAHKAFLSKTIYWVKL